MEKRWGTPPRVNNIVHKENGRTHTCTTRLRKLKAMQNNPRKKNNLVRRQSSGLVTRMTINLDILISSEFGKAFLSSFRIKKVAHDDDEERGRRLQRFLGIDCCTANKKS